MPLRKKRTAPWTPNGAGRRFHSASGTEKYNPSAHCVDTFLYTREALRGGFTWLGGVPGRISASGGQKRFWAPAIFLWYRQAAPSLSKKEMVGPTVPHTECGFPVPRRARNPSSPAGESLVPRRARNVQRLEALFQEVRPLSAKIGWAAPCAEIICGPRPQILRPPLLRG